MKQNWSFTLYLLLLITLGYAATDIYLPSLPSIGEYFQASDQDVQMTLITYLASFSLSPLIFGPLSDHFGRRTIIFFGILCSIFTAAACLFAPSVEWLSLLRFFQGFGGGAVMIAARATVVDNYTGKELTKQMSTISMLMPLVLAVAPVLGGYLQEAFGWQSVFLFLTVYMGVVLALFTLKGNVSSKLHHDKKLKEAFAIYRSHLTNKMFLSYSLNYILPSIGFFSYLTVSPFLFQDVIGLSPAEYGTTSLFIGAIILTTGFVNLRLIQLFKVTQILQLGACLILLSGLLLLTFYFLGMITKWTVLLPVLVFFCCGPLCSANGASLALRQVNSHFGAASALLNSCQLMTGACTSFIISRFSDQSTLSLATCFIFVAVASLVNLRLVEEEEPEVLSS